MESEDDWIDPLKKFIRDHEDVSEFLEHLGKMLSFQHVEEAWRQIKPIEDFFRQNIIAHFKFEEQIVFPAILSKCATP